MAESLESGVTDGEGEDRLKTLPDHSCKLVVSARPEYPKQRAIRASNLTALSAGAVYANGLQLVRYTNALLLTAAAINLVAIFAAGDLTFGAAYLLPDSDKLALIKAVQYIQKMLFGIDEPFGIYPLLISDETLSIASQNGLKNTWPTTNPLSWSLPIPPSPILIFNIATLDSNLAQAVIPNMALKFRNASFFLAGIPKEKKMYKYESEDDGKTRYLNSDQVELARKSKNNGQMRVKTGSGLKGAGKFVTEVVSRDLSKLNKLIQFANLFAAINLDVTDRDVPAIHNIYVYASYPTPLKDSQNNNAEIQTLSETRVSGTGLAAWNLNDPPYHVTIAPTDPLELVKQLTIQTLISRAVNSIRPPSISNIFRIITNGSI